MNELKLDEFVVLEKKKRDGIYLFIVEKAHTPTICPRCGSGPEFLVKHGKRERYVRDSAIDDHPVDLLILHARYKCKSCGKTFYEPIECTDDHSKITNRFKNEITSGCFRKPFLQIARDYDISHTTVMRVFDESLHQMDLHRKIYTPEALAIDRLFINREMLTIFSDPAKNLLLDINRDIGWERNTSLLDIMEPGFRETIFADPVYVQSRVLHRRFPDSTIVLDRYHMEKLINRIFNCQIRKALWLKKIKNVNLINDMHNKFIRNQPLDKDPFPSSPFRVEDSCLFQTYKLLLNFKMIYSCESKSDANRYFSEWRESASIENEPFISRLVAMLDNFKPEILNYFNHKKYGNCLDSIHSLPKLLESQKYSTSFEATRGRILFGNESIQTEEDEIRHVPLKHIPGKPNCSILVRKKSLGVLIPSLIGEIQNGHF